VLASQNASDVNELPVIHGTFCITRIGMGQAPIEIDFVPAMAQLRINSLADAKRRVQILNMHPSDAEMRKQVEKSISVFNWAYLFQARYADFILQQTETWTESDIGTVRHIRQTCESGN
jgi:hypothetical protein